MPLVDLREMAVLRYGEDGEVPVCPRCSALVSPLDHYCAECHAPLGLAPSIPFVWLWAVADFLIRFADSVTGKRSWLGIVFLVVLFHAGPPALPLIPVYLLIRLWRRRRP